MTLPVQVDSVIEVVSRLKDSVAGLYEAYALLPAVLEKEHRAIAAHDFAAVSGILPEKEAIGDRIEACFSALTTAGERLGNLRWRLTGEAAPRPATLSDCLATLEPICAAFPVDPLGGQVLRHLVDRLKTLVGDFQALHARVKPEVEGNKAEVAVILRHVQESYRFWQEIQETTPAGYTAQGTQRSTGMRDGFKTKA